MFRICWRYQKDLALQWQKLVSWTKTQPKGKHYNLKTSWTYHGRVFLGVQRLAQLHSILLRDIAPRLRGWTANSSIGDCLTVFFSNPQLAELYSAYAHNFRESREELLSLYHSNKAFASFVDTKQSPAGMGSGIHYLLSLCISIIQRVPRYELLFKDLQRYVHSVSTS